MSKIKKHQNKRFHRKVKTKKKSYLTLLLIILLISSLLLLVVVQDRQYTNQIAKPKPTPILVTPIAKQAQIYSGVGMRLNSVEGKIMVVGLVNNTPAQKAGILPGDEIVAVDGVYVKNSVTQNVVDKIRGPVNTSVTLQLKRNDMQLTKTLIRTTITNNSPATCQ